MRKLIAVGVLLGGLLSGAGSAMAQIPPIPLPPNIGGLGDPLTLAASGVLIPYTTGTAGGTVALIEVASPVNDNPNLHMLFYNSNCARVGDSVGIPETVNDIAFQDVFTAVGAATGYDGGGLVAIAGVDNTGFNLRPLRAPIHSRIYLFTVATGRSQVFEPITLDTAEAADLSTVGGVGFFTWNPLRTGATFYAPLETASVKTRLTLVCPRTTIQGAAVSAFPTDFFPEINPPFQVGPPAADYLRARIYDTNEILKRDVRFTCDCFTDLSVTSISSFYGSAPEASLGTYTEVEVTNGERGTFTGYRSVSTLGSALNNFFGRLSNGSRESIQGPVALPFLR